MKACQLSLTVLSLVVATTVTAAAQQVDKKWNVGFGSLSAKGRVVDAKSKPEPGVPVEISGPSGKVYAVTDQSGNWHVYNLPAGKYNVQAADIGRGSDSSSVSFTIEQEGFLHRWFGGGERVKEAAEIKLPVDQLRSDDARSDDNGRER